MEGRETWGDGFWTAPMGNTWLIHFREVRETLETLSDFLGRKFHFQNNLMACQQIYNTISCTQMILTLTSTTVAVKACWSHLTI